VVAPASRELIEAAPRPDILQAVASATKGRTLESGDALATLPWRDPERIEVASAPAGPCGTAGRCSLLLCLVVGAEWTLRRRWGYA